MVIDKQQLMLDGQTITSSQMQMANTMNGICQAVKPAKHLSQVTNPFISEGNKAGFNVEKVIADKFVAKRTKPIHAPVNIEKNIEKFHKKLTEVFEITVNEIKEK
ncbi:hypothetical protein Cni_G02490 [Canna indica]|uniref:Uncharacterized protein n=1 Tax=Canna indica TaxID=4628 RepID=A0AAQ3Q2D8_9LILI|nr:hypothetical protein Cni_G02490 [Canna indica]